MNLRLRWLSLPLLGRELVEMSKRRRTYALRSACALLAAAVIAIFLMQEDNLIGKGADIVKAMLWGLLGVVSLVLPATCANSVIKEKEQGTLVLLLLTPMGPWRLVLQKWLSQVTMMLSLVLTFLPVLALAYSCGGVDTSNLLLKILCLVLTIFQFAAVGVAVSSWCRGVTIALLLIYLLLVTQCLIALYLLQGLMEGSDLVGLLGWLCWTSPAPLLWNPSDYFFLQNNPYRIDSVWSYLPSVLSTLVFLVAARWSLTRVSSQPGPSLLLRGFKLLDRTFLAIDARFGRTYARELPGDLPVLWRESHRRSFTSFRYLVRILVVPVTVSVLLATDMPAEIYMGTLVLVLIVSVTYHAIAFDRDRQEQGMDVILSTPMSATGLVAQKSRSLARVRWCMSAWLILLAAMDGVASGSSWSKDSAVRHWHERVLAELAIALLLPMIVSWFAFAVSMRIRSRLLAFFLSFLPIIFWLVVLPWLLCAIPFVQSLGNPLPFGEDLYGVACLFSPLLLVIRADYPLFFQILGWRGCLISCAIYVGVIIFLRWRCLHLRPATMQLLMTKV